MNLIDFINKYDHENAIILLEGKRKVLTEDCEKLISLGKLLASRTSKMIFRSGNAEGSDELFSEGVCLIDQKRLQVVTPYDGHRKKQNLAYETFSLDSINIAEDEELIYQSKTNKKTEKLIDSYVSGNKNRNTVKAAYIIRDTVKVLGTSTIKPATFGIFYIDLSDPDSGGTGHTINVSRLNNIPVIDQRTWFKWLEE
jgi:hypothetical protein